MQPRSGLVQSADAQIFYLEYPSPHPHAQTLILLHGNGEAHRYFARQIAAFSARFRLVLMDTRGQGRSSAGRGKLPDSHLLTAWRLTFTSSPSCSWVSPAAFRTAAIWR